MHYYVRGGEIVIPGRKVLHKYSDPVNVDMYVKQGAIGSHHFYVMTFRRQGFVLILISTCVFHARSMQGPRQFNALSDCPKSLTSSPPLQSSFPCTYRLEPEQMMLVADRHGRIRHVTNILAAHLDTTIDVLKVDPILRASPLIRSCDVDAHHLLRGYDSCTHACAPHALLILRRRTSCLRSMPSCLSLSLRCTILSSR